MNKGQAALEFLTTYAWAIAVVLVMIGAVLYFGIFDTSLLVKPYCSVSKELVCDDHSVYQNAAKIRLRNNFEKPITLYNITLITADGSQQATCDLLAISLPVGKRVDMGCGFAGDVLEAGQKERVGVRVEFSRTGGTNTYTVSGSLLESALDSTTCAGMGGSCAFSCASNGNFGQLDCGASRYCCASPVTG